MAAVGGVERLGVEGLELAGVATAGVEELEVMIGSAPRRADEMGVIVDSGLTETGSKVLCDVRMRGTVSRMLV